MLIKPDSHQTGQIVKERLRKSKTRRAPLPCIVKTTPWLVLVKLCSLVLMKIMVGYQSSPATPCLVPCLVSVVGTGPAYRKALIDTINTNIIDTINTNITQLQWSKNGSLRRAHVVCDRDVVA